MRAGEIIILVLIILFFALGIGYYPKMPEQMATHWNASGQVNGYMSRFWGVFLLPIIFLGIALLFIAIPRIDPLKKNIQDFRKYYDGFIVVFFLFMLAVYLMMLLWNVGIEISHNLIMPIGIGILFFCAGVLIEHAKRNWSIGIRTPWTLSNDKVWQKTHKLGAKLFKIAGIIAIIGVFFKNYALWFVLAPIIIVAVYLVFYSYFEYQKEMK